MAGVEPKSDCLDSGNNVRESEPNQMNSQLKCEGGGCIHRMGSDRPPCFPENCAIINLGSEGNHAGLSDKEENFHPVDMEYDAEMQYIYGDLEPLEESKYLALPDWESAQWLHPHNGVMVEQSIHADAESASRLLLGSITAWESVMTMQPETDWAAPEENCDPSIGSGRLRIQPYGDEIEASETLAQTEAQQKHKASGPIVSNDFVLPDFISKPHNSTSGEQNFQAEVESALRCWSFNSSVVEQNVQAEAESAWRLLPDFNLLVEESGDNFEAFEPTLTQTEPQGKPNAGSLILENDLTLPNFDTKSHISVSLKPKLPNEVEFALRLQPQYSMMVEQNIQAEAESAEAESASRILLESNPVRESAMTMQPEGDGAGSEENYEPKNGNGILTTPACGDHIEASRPTSAQAEPQLKRKADSPIIENDQCTCLQEDSAVTRKAKRRINSVGHVDEEQQ